MVIKVISCTTRRPLARHQPTSSLLASGTRIPGPANSDAAPMRALRSSLVSPTVWPKMASPSGAVSADPAVVLDHQGAVDGVGDFAMAVVAALADARRDNGWGPGAPGSQHFDDRSHTQLAVRPASPFRLIMYVLDAASYVIEYFVGYRPVFWYSCGSFRSLVTVGLLSK